MDRIRLLSISIYYVTKSENSSRHNLKLDPILLHNSLQNYKMLHSSKLNAFADNSLNVVQRMDIVLDMVGNIVGEKGENAGYHEVHFSIHKFANNELFSTYHVMNTNF